MSEVDGFVVLAEFDLPPDRQEEFVRLVRANAEHSVRDEPGCRRFDVLLPEAPSGPGVRIALYEIYRDRAAFDAHLATPHYLAFQKATETLFTGRAVRRFDLYENAKGV